MTSRGIPAKLLCGLLLAASLLVPTRAARAATWTVSGTGDDSGTAACTGGVCPTLRDAITTAAAGDSINLSSLSGAITLTTGSELAISQNLSITGPGANKLAVRAAASESTASSRVFEITAGTVGIYGITISNGDGNGGSGGLTVGGGVSVDSEATLTLNNCTVAGNAAAGGAGGGGIANNGTLTVIDSTINGNSATGYGGGIGNDGVLTITNSTIFGNSNATTGGGGIYNGYSGTLTLTSSTITANSAADDGGGGGGIFNGNEATLLDSLVAGNSASSDNDVFGDFDEDGTFGNNLIGDLNADAAGFSKSDADIFGSDASPIALSSLVQTSSGTPVLAFNGGGTQTVALIAGSPAVDTGNDEVVNSLGLTTDQRGSGYPRLAGQNVDIGAYELQGQPLHAVSQSLATYVSAITITFSATGGTGAATFTCSAPSHGTLGAVTNGNQVVYTPASGYVGADSFTFTATDTTNATSQATITIADDGALSLVVNTTADNDSACTVANCPLRGAIANAEGGSFGANPTVTFDIPASDPNDNGGSPIISLDGSPLVINGNVAINTDNQSVTVNGNDASAVFQITGGTVAMTGLTVTGGSAGGIQNAGILTVTGCTINGNSAPSQAGAGLANSGTLTLFNSTIAGNSSGVNGGGIDNSGLLSIANSTLVANTSSGNGGGIYSNGTAALLNTLVAGNAAAKDNDVFGAYDASGTVGNNLVGDLNADASGFSTTNHDQFGSDTSPLAISSLVQTTGGDTVLANNGGPTETIALVNGSLAINGGNSSVLQAPDSLTTDQRGDPRESGSAVDIGAYEAQLPSITSIANQSVSLPGNTGALSFTIGDSVAPLVPLTVAGTSSNTAIVPNANIVIAGSGDAQTVTVSPVSSGTCTITLTVTDPSTGFTASTTFTLTVTGNPPTISSIANHTVVLPGNTGALAFTLGDSAGPVTSLKVAGSSSNTAVVPAANLVFGGSGASRTVTVTPTGVGYSNITLTVTDPTTTLTASTTFVVTVVTPPTISSIGNHSVLLPGNTGAVALTVGDNTEPVASLTLTGSSSDATVVPAGNIAFGGSGASRTVTVTPAAVGSSIITVTVTDPATGLTASATFTVTVSAPAPAISAIANKSVVLPANTGAIAFTVGDAGDPASTLTVAGSSSNTTVVPNGSIVFSGSGASRSVTVTPAARGYSVITVTVTDPATGLTAKSTFTVVATALPPTISSIGNETVTLPANTGAIAFTLGDGSEPVANLTLTGSSSNATVVPNANIVFGGSGASRTVTVSPAARGYSIITVTVTDPATGLAVQGTFTVVCLVPPPTISAIANQTVTLPANTGALAITLGDVSEPVSSLTLTGSSSNTAVVPSANIVFGGSGANRTVTVSPVAHGYSVITITVTDPASGLTVQGTFTVVCLVPPPTISAIANQTVTLPANTGALAITLGDVSAPVANLTLTASSSNTSVVPAANIVFGGSGANRTVTVSGVIQGYSVITITVTDPATALTAQGSFTVVAIAPPPTIGAIANQTVTLPGNTGALALTLGDAGEPVASLGVTSTSSNTKVVPPNNIVITGSGANRTLTVTPTAPGSSLITLTAADPASGKTATTTFTVTALPGLSIGNAAVSVGASGSTSASFTVTLTNASSNAITVAYATTGGTATAGTDYTAANGTLSIPAGSTSGTITVTVLGTAVDASGLTFNVVLSNPVNASINSGIGTCTITHLAKPLTVSLSPTSLSSSTGTASTLTATYGDNGGNAALTQVQFCVGTNGAPSTSLYAEYLPATNLLYLFNASNVAVGGFAPGTSNVITTTLGSLNCASTTVSRSGNNLTVAWSITPTASLAGKQYAYLQASDAGSGTAWTAYGTWTISVAGPSVVSLTPTSLSTSTGTAETLTSTYADGGGNAALTKVQLCVGANGAPSTSLYAEYLPATNLLYLFNASNVAVGGFAPGSNNVITTTLGTLNCAATTVTKSGNNLTVAWNITPTASLDGTQYTYLQATDANTSTPWTVFGTWTISGTTTAAYPISPSAPSS